MMQKRNQNWTYNAELKAGKKKKDRKRRVSWKNQVLDEDRELKGLTDDAGAFKNLSEW